MTRALLFLLMLCAGCVSGEDNPTPASDRPWITVTLENRTGEVVVEAALNPFETVGYGQQALDAPLEPGAEQALEVRAGTWSLRYVTESGREVDEPALALEASRRIALE